MKMIFAMLHSEDVDETVEELNKKKYWVTKLSTTGGFLKNKNVTLVIGTEDENVPGAIKILKECAGARQSVKYTMPSMSSGSIPHPIIFLCSSISSDMPLLPVWISFCVTVLTPLSFQSLAR